MEKSSFFGKSKKSVRQVTIFLVLEILILGIYLIGVRGAREVGREKAISKLEESTYYSVLCEVENVELKDDKVEFSGWAFYPNARNKGIAVVLCETESGKEHVLLAELEEKEHIEDYFMLNGCSGDVGFRANVKKTELMQEKCYEILIALTYESESDGKVSERERKIIINQFYYDGEIHSYNPKTFTKPEIQDEGLARVVEEGDVRGFDSESGVWIYQYEKKLYYIIDSSVNRVSKEANVCIPVMPRTLRRDLLSDKRRQYGYDHLGAFYADESYNVEGVSPYQVVVVELPLEYPITYVETGLYDSNKKTWIKRLVIPMFDWRMYDAK